jgi:hypothetical protein
MVLMLSFSILVVLLNRRSFVLVLVLQKSEYNATEKRVVWNIKKFPGTTEQTLRIKVRTARLTR